MALGVVQELERLDDFFFPHYDLACARKNKSITDLLLKGDKHYKTGEIRFDLIRRFINTLNTGDLDGKMTKDEFRFYMSLDGFSPKAVLHPHALTVYQKLLKNFQLDLLEICVNEFGLNIKSFFDITKKSTTPLFESGIMDRCRFSGCVDQDRFHKLIPFLFSKGLNPDQFLAKGEPLLHFILRELSVKTLDLFIKNGASMDLRSMTG